MKTILLAILLGLPGCITLDYIGPDGKHLKYQKPAIFDTNIDQLEVTTPNGSVKVTGYKNKENLTPLLDKALDKIPSVPVAPIP